MKILAIETATEACSAALLINNNVENNTISRFQLAPREHTKLLLPMMEELIEEADIELDELDAIAFSRGPGAFTGLRIAAGVAQGVALSINKPVIPISTLTALAHSVNNNIIQGGKVIAALDARMGEVYWSSFNEENEKLVRVANEQVTKPEDMLDMALKESRVIAVGAGWDAYRNDFFSKGINQNITLLENEYPHAELIAKIAMQKFSEGKVVAPENAQPIYIRNKVAEKSIKKV